MKEQSMFNWFKKRTEENTILDALKRLGFKTNPHFAHFVLPGTKKEDTYGQYSIYDQDYESSSFVGKMFFDNNGTLVKFDTGAKERVKDWDYVFKKIKQQKEEFRELKIALAKITRENNIDLAKYMDKKMETSIQKEILKLVISEP